MRDKGGACGILPRRPGTAGRHYFWETVGDGGGGGRGEVESTQVSRHWS